MIEFLAGLLFMGAAGLPLAFYLGVRRERGRQARYEEVTRVERQARKGTRLNTIKLRR